jgi:lysozyme
MTYILGCDLSEWQRLKTDPTHINYSQMYHAGVRFVIYRAGIGTYHDKVYVSDYLRAIAHRLLVTHYWYLRWDVSITDQITHYLDVCNQTHMARSLWLDYEERKNITTRKDISGRLVTAVNMIHSQLGLYPGIYTSPGFWQEYYSLDPVIANCALWIAHWGVAKPIVPKGWTDWTFWQYQIGTHGEDYGVQSKSIDLDVYRYDYPALYRLFGQVYIDDAQLSPADQMRKLLAIHQD